MKNFSLGAIRFLIFITIFVFACKTVSAQTLGDYRSIASGNWTSTSIWQVYNGTSWISATNYPGQLAGTNDVYIQGGYSVTLTSNIPNTLNSLTVGDGTGATDNFYIGNTSSLQTELVTIENGGWVEWTANKDFSLPSGAAFVVNSGGTLATDNPCSASKRLIIGSTTYSTCNGNGSGIYSFQDINDSGGTIAVTPSSNGPICEGETLNLYSNPSGAGASSATYSWSATGPSGYSYSSTSENPVINGLTAGSYTYTVTISDGTINNTKSVGVTVNAAPSIVLQPQDQETFKGSNVTFSITSLNADTFQWQVSTDNGANYANISDGSAYSGTQTENLTIIAPDMNKNGYLFRVLVSNVGSSCNTPVTSDAATLTVKSGSVVTNRGVTYRVNKN
ncbi:hypothetical protein [Allomuricauda sp. NBRC 101325]|uniref:hypothetical protein n=1 Tax=Allomuricauda sp. NBRC 101325 TaxID=1113758 RepID=UPI0024A54B61|nr:hypothetical protein [Muricauda sp. NBRC 101325]GLU42720.1 hypothetical protein Musp01_03440 [Muricauda sp. NBRC 101325]